MQVDSLTKSRHPLSHFFMSLSLSFSFSFLSLSLSPSFFLIPSLFLPRQIKALKTDEREERKQQQKTFFRRGADNKEEDVTLMADKLVDKKLGGIAANDSEEFALRAGF
jgi:hypothetical protein